MGIVKKSRNVGLRKQRAENKTIRVVIPPSPISQHFQGPGVAGDILLRYMFPVRGKVYNGTIDIVKEGNDAVSIQVRSATMEGGAHSDFILHDGLNTIPLEYTVVLGEKVIVELKKGSVKEAWVSFLFEVGVRRGMIGKESDERS